MTVDVDVAVVGGGGCGMVAALRAARAGLTVAVFEKSTQHGCNTQVSSGSLAAAGTRWQRAAGIDDSVQRQVDDIVRESGDESTRPLVEAVCTVAPLYLEWLADELGHPVTIGDDMRRHGMTAPRLHTDTAFLGKVNAMFEGDFKLNYHLAPPIMAKKNDKGELVKRSFGPWMTLWLSLLART